MNQELETKRARAKARVDYLNSLTDMVMTHHSPADLAGSPQFVSAVATLLLADIEAERELASYKSPELSPKPGQTFPSPEAFERLSNAMR